MPREESASPCALRKWPSAARPPKDSAYRAVPSWLARSLISVVGSPWRVIRAAFPAQTLPETKAVNRPASFSDKAILFRERKFRLGADCCKTSGRGARDFRRGRRQAGLFGLRAFRAGVVLRNEVRRQGWQRKEGKVLRCGRNGLRTPQSTALRRRAAK